jgi:hypothetical protein
MDQVTTYSIKIDSRFLQMTKKDYVIELIPIMLIENTIKNIRRTILRKCVLIFAVFFK